MNEKTLVKTMRLPHDEPWAWYADSNLVVLCPSLDAEGRERALGEVQDHWRRSCLRVVGSDDEAVRVPVARDSTIREVIEAL